MSELYDKSLYKLELDQVLEQLSLAQLHQQMIAGTVIKAPNSDVGSVAATVGSKVGTGAVLLLAHPVSTRRISTRARVLCFI